MDFIAGWAYAEMFKSRISLPNRIWFSKILCCPWNHKVSVSAKKNFKKISCLCTFKEAAPSLYWEPRGVRKVAYNRYMSRTVAMEVCLLFNFDCIFIFNIFPFPPSKAQSLGNVPMNRKDTANYSPLIWICFLCTREIEMHLAPIGNTFRICSVYNFQI